MVSTWMGDHSVVEVDDVEKNSVKSLEWRNGASNKNFLATKIFFGLHVHGLLPKTWGPLPNTCEPLPNTYGLLPNTYGSLIYTCSTPISADFLSLYSCRVNVAFGFMSFGSMLPSGL